ncbi:homoserine O-acetyltransferase [Candidatus Sulfidibacterium hydrothermale]|uniref:homoserine O-acetyltransferase family protein n=1 Tax=Candidatus Sulfidibacterium hydrothermale TaxID=2875962 RepID=UPI001F0A5430|nr:homoserine O-acetyltransferase [Candidatus Sulfidibacterium hydrothermale]UBM61790.1 homoserine O-acetyltransferase [Candidatus Sulfidibacterium hydrothermale]
MIQKLKIDKPFLLESGKTLHELEIAFHTYGKLNATRDNVVWICHALTANSDVADWWSGMTGPGKCFDPEKHFIVCANILGSCYGTTGPLSKDENGEIYYHRFPDITIRDMVKAHQILREHLGIEKIELLTGGSIGSFQAVEWAITEPDRIRHLVLIAGGASITAWTAGLNEAQRMAIRADKSYYDQTPDGGKDGMKAARAMALLSYRNARAYNKTQPILPDDDYRNLKAITYQQYQGEKLARRFDARAYYILTRAFDSHHAGRGRGGLPNALAAIKAKTLVVGIDTDILFPKEDQEILAKYIPDAQLQWLHSEYGHDGFLLEFETLTNIITDFWN